MKLQKTTSVTLFGVLNIVFAALGIVGVISSVMLFLVAGDASKNPVIQIIHDNPAYGLWMKISIPLGLLSAGALLAAGMTPERVQEVLTEGADNAGAIMTGINRLIRVLRG